MKISPEITRKHKGQSLAELATAFTLLLLLFTGVIDIGSIFYTLTALQDTTQEGAIFGASNPTAQTLIVNHIKNSASYPIQSANITDITITCGGAPCVTTTINSCQGQKITIDVGYTYNLIMPIIPALIGRNSVLLKTTVTSTILQSTDTIEALKALPTPQTCP